jgi:hypothetical protein
VKVFAKEKASERVVLGNWYRQGWIALPTILDSKSIDVVCDVVQEVGEERDLKQLIEGDQPEARQVVI